MERLASAYDSLRREGGDEGERDEELERGRQRDPCPLSGLTDLFLGGGGGGGGGEGEMVPLRGRGIGIGPDGYGDGDGDGGDRAAMGDIPRSVSVQSMTDTLNDDDDRDDDRDDNDRDDDDERRRSRGSGSSFAPDAVGWTPEDENGVGWDKSTACESRIRSVRWKMRYLTGPAAVSAHGASL